MTKVSVTIKEQYRRAIQRKRCLHQNNGGDIEQKTIFELTENSIIEQFEFSLVC